MTIGTIEKGATKPFRSNWNFPVLVLGAIGVVYGDIGTSPIYAFREALSASGANADSNGPQVIGLLSLIVWTLMIVVTMKYVGLVLKADNKGEGGTLSLMALARNCLIKRPVWVLVIGIIGASLFIGDAIITPAISVLSAVEGLEIVAPHLAKWVLPTTLAVIAALFFVQRFGTARVAVIFGPVTAVWFLAIGASGLSHILQAPDVLMALNPQYGAQFLIENYRISITVLGAVFLAVTGAEALYVDLGHFGRKPIALAWFALVFPCLLLNYFGQGAFVLAHPGHVDHPFFEMQPTWALLPMVLLATMATVIASQAVISGTFSLVSQAMHLNLLPRFAVHHTSETQPGQIFMPQINFLLFLAVSILVLVFQKSSALSAAYGITVSGQMLLTTILLSVVALKIWRWRPVVIIAALLPLLVVDGTFFLSNLAKFAEGGWVPLAISVFMAFLMQTWISGRKLLADRTKGEDIPLERLFEMLAKTDPTIVSGTAIFLTNDVETRPTALFHSLKHFKVLHQHNVVLTIKTSSAPTVPDVEKIVLRRFTDLFSHATLTFGYMETPDIPKALGSFQPLANQCDMASTSFFLSHRTITPSPQGGMPLWQDRVFIALARNASDATEYYHLPTGRVVELGVQVAI
ncbi:MAG: potassium transporter Kup [Micavibrio sp.]|nr:potassium transporter Kup [Micavibrio sp.]